MKYRTLPKYDEKISTLGYGCMRLPTHFGGEASSLIDKEKAINQIRYAIDQGVNYIDTAYPYHLGASESFIGEHILTDGYRDKVNIATKLPCFMINEKERIDEIFNKQLEKLQVECIDYYLLHALNGNLWEKMKKLGIIEFMDRIKEKKQIRYMGFSFHGQPDDFIKIVDEYDWDFAQVQYNIIDENFQAGKNGIEYAASKNVGIFIMEPLRGGTLVNRIPKEVQEIYDRAETKRSPADWAFRWILNNPNVTMVLSGMNVEEHIKENIKVASEVIPEGLTAHEETILQQVRKKYNELLKVGCTGCAYCMPCPAKIDIPGVFKNINNYYMFSKMGAIFYHTMQSGIQTKDGKAHWAENCLDCGKCEEHCPQDIAIRDELKLVSRKLEKPPIKLIARLGRMFSR